MLLGQNGAFWGYGCYRMLTGNLMLEVETMPLEVAETTTQPSSPPL